ncbi:MAG TPA: c-type cytochrome domain-containing protein [Gallionella sp.]|nr:c-type cytochrome domain-containing protein [Gallionella sp.]
MKNRILQCVAVVASLSFSALASAAALSPTVSFKSDVTPIIHDYCLNCHEPGGKGYEKSGLDLRTYDSLMKGTRFGSVVKPGDSFTSILVQVVDGRVHASIKMPYGMAGGLSKANIGVLKRWIDQGAKND